MEALLGVDYTSIGNLKELIFDGEDISGSNIANLDPQIISSSASVLFGTDGTLKDVKIDSASIADYGAIADLVQLRKTNGTGLGNDLQTELDKRKLSQWAYNLVVDSSKFEANAGDKVVLTISNYNSYVNFAGSAIVN